MTVFDLLAVFGVGLFAGMVNTIAGAGSLVTFPVLVALGLPPLTANVTNSLGVVPGSVTGAMRFGEQLKGAGARLKVVVPLAAVGSLAGGVLLVALPGRGFALVAPALVGVASLLMLLQPMISRHVELDPHASSAHPRLFGSCIVATAVYGGYFGTGIGVLFFAVLGTFVADTPARLNAVKTVLQGVANGVAGILFAFVAPVNWVVAAVLGVATACGAPVGARLSVRMRPGPLRVVIGCFGIAAAIVLGLRAF